VLFASIPPTFAAAFIITSGISEFILDFVSSKENKFVSALVDPTTLEKLLEALSFLISDEPTKPLLPKIKTLISYPFSFYSKKILTLVSYKLIKIKYNQLHVY